MTLSLPCLEVCCDLFGGVPVVSMCSTKRSSSRDSHTMKPMRLSAPAFFFTVKVWVWCLNILGGPIGWFVIMSTLTQALLGGSQPRRKRTLSHALPGRAWRRSPCSSTWFHASCEVSGSYNSPLEGHSCFSVSGRVHLLLTPLKSSYPNESSRVWNPSIVADKLITQ